MLSVAGRVAIFAFAVLFVASCQSAPKGKPPPNYMVEIDRIVISFDRLAGQWDSIGEGLISIEKERFVLTPGSSDGLSDADATERTDQLLDKLYDINQQIETSARLFVNNTKIPKSKDRDGIAVYVAHNAALKSLFIALLGRDGKKILLESPFDDGMVEVTTDTDQQVRKLRITDLISKGVVVLPDHDSGQNLGYLAAIKNYLLVQKHRLNGRRKVTVCELEEEGDKKFSCVAKNHSIMFGGSQSLMKVLWGELYDDGKEKKVVVAMKDIMRTRGRISEFLSQSQ